MKRKFVRLFREVREIFIREWSKLIVLINKVCLLLTFILIPVLLIDIMFSLHYGNYVTSLVQSLVLVLIIHSNKQL